jgi:hypothetical protein
MDTTSDPSGGMNGSVFLLQQVSVYREKLIQNKDWEMMSNQQRELVFTMEDKNDPDLRSLAGLYSDDLVEGIMEPQSGQGGQDGDDEYEEINSQLRSRWKRRSRSVELIGREGRGKRKSRSREEGEREGGDNLNGWTRRKIQKNRPFDDVC